MMQTARMTRGLVVRGMWVWIAAVSMLAQAQPQPGTRPLSIEGVVTGVEDRPEAGIWVIAESGDLPTPMRKIVVTDDAGRFVVPDLPAGSLGFVWLPALLPIVAVSMLVAPLGARIAHRMPAKLLRRLFALTTFALALNMARSLVWG